MRAIPWDDSPPRAVQVVFRHGAIVLMAGSVMPLLCRNRPERRCNPPFSHQDAQSNRQQRGVRFAPKRWHQQDEHRATQTFTERNAQILRAAPVWLQPAALNRVGSGCFETSETIQARPLMNHCRVSEENGFEPNALELTPITCP